MKKLIEFSIKCDSNLIALHAKPIAFCIDLELDQSLFSPPKFVDKDEKHETAEERGR